MTGRTTEDSATHQPGLTRRRILGLVGGSVLAGVSGCAGMDAEAEERAAGEPVSLTIKAPPADADPRAIRIARSLANHLTAVGATVNVVPIRRETLQRDVLLNQQFDVYVGRFPAPNDPDFLHSLFHSTGAAAAGWQNPFGLADQSLDRLLDRQRSQTGAQRRQTLAAVQHELARLQPLSILGFVDELRAHRSAITPGTTKETINSRRGYLALSVDDPGTGTASYKGSSETTTATSDSSSPIRMALTDIRPLKNLNPLSVTSRAEGAITSLLYDSLGERIDGRIQPWLAKSWSWTGMGTLDVELRDDINWHDGTPIDARDVEFTYEFLEDTSLGTAETPVPAPRFAGRTSAVTGVEPLGASTVRFRFDGVSRPVASRALEVPLLPLHIWKEKTETALIGGLDTEKRVTDALAWANRSPVGSGAFEVESLSVQKQLSLVPFADHFLQSAAESLLEKEGVQPPERGRTFRRAPSGGAALALLQNADADVTARGLLPKTVPRIRSDPTLELSVTPTTTFYHVGYNTRRAPLDDPEFRRATARLLDAEFFAETVCEGYVEPAASPLTRHEALSAELAWSGRNPVVPFAGSADQLDVEQARSAFEAAGYQFTTDGTMVVT